MNSKKDDSWLSEERDINQTFKQGQGYEVSVEQGDTELEDLTGAFIQSSAPVTAKENSHIIH